MMSGIAGRVASILNANGCPHVLAGGVAAIYYGVPRFTHDVDFLVSRPSAAETKTLLPSFKDEGFSFDAKKARRAFARGGIFRMEGIRGFVEGFIVDIVVLPEIGPIIERSKLVKGVGARIISPEDLIIQKLLVIKKTPAARPRPQDKEDVLMLLVAQRGQLDMRYLHKAAVEYGIDGLLKKFLKKSAKV